MDKKVINSRQEKSYNQPFGQVSHFKSDKTINLPNSSESLNRLRENPFSVTEDDIKALSLDLVIRLASNGNSLRAFPKFNSKAKKIIEKIKGVHYLKSENSYYLPTQELNGLLKKLRDNKLLFAIEEITANILMEGADTRAKILSTNSNITESNLGLALFSPYISYSDYYDETDSNIYFALKNYTTTQLRELFPWVTSFEKRKILARMFDSKVLYKVLQRQRELKWKLWITDAVKEDISKNEEEFKQLTEHEQLEQTKRLEKAIYFNKLKNTDLDPGLFTNSAILEKLYPHQKVAIKWLIENDYSLLGDDMGLGKTLSVLSAFEALKSCNKNDFLLVICPNSLTRNWLREASNWFPNLKLLMIGQDKKEKINFFKKLSWGDYKPDGLVINYEAIRLEYVLPEVINLLQNKNTFLCLDESQRVKSPTAQTFQAISNIAPLCPRRVLLSGTPTPKDISDIWSQIYLLDQGERFGKSFYRWLEQVAELGTKYSDFAVKKYKQDKVRESILRVQEILLRRKKEDVVNLPEKIFITRDVPLLGEQLKRYEEIRKELLLRVTSVNGKTFIREINNILEEYLRAVQVASNPRLIDEGWKGEPAKFKELDLLVEDIVKEREEKIVIWTNYLGNVRELIKRYQHFGAKGFSGEVSTKDREESIRKFQDPKSEVKILIAVPAAGGVGITLTAAQTAIYLDKTWNAEHWMQSIDRVHRIGQTGTVRIISLHSSRVDDLIAKNLKRKTNFQNEVFNIENNIAEILEVEREELLEAVKK